MSDGLFWKIISLELIFFYCMDIRRHFKDAKICVINNCM